MVRKRGIVVRDNMLVFKEKETHTEIIYVIAYYAKNSWYHYLDFPNIDDAKENIEKVRKRNPNMRYGLFEKIEQVTANKLDEKCL